MGWSLPLQLEDDHPSIVTSKGMGWSLPLQLEDDHPSIVTSSKQVEGRMSSNHPEPVMLSPEGVQTCPLSHVPHPDGLVLAVGEDELLPGVEDGTRHVVIVASTRVHLPSLVIIHPPQLDLSVICPTHYEGHGGVKVSPVHPPIMTLQNVLNNGVRLSE